MCNEQNQEEVVVYHSAKVDGVDPFEDDAIDGYSLGKAHLNLI